MTRYILPQLRLSIDVPLARPDAPNYRPLTWPPHPDWPVVLDASGGIVSRWGDSVWRLDPWAGKRVTLNFGDGPLSKHVSSIDKANADLLRSVVGWWIYGPNSSRGVRGLKARFDLVRHLFALCAVEGISASSVSQFPRIVERFASKVQKSRASELYTLLHDLFENRNVLGFTLLDRNSIVLLASLIPRHKKIQTAYIPPRIWSYQAARLRECLDDYLFYQEKIENLFEFCVEVYDKGFVKKSRGRGRRRPFPSSLSNLNQVESYVPFDEVVKSFGLDILIHKWVLARDGVVSIRDFTFYLNLVSKVGLAYILNFSLMRVEEAWNLRVNCLEVENDPKFGCIYLLHGVTTKTVSDSKAIWIASPSVKFAVDAMQSIALLRSGVNSGRSSVKALSRESGPYLIDYEDYPWSSKRPRDTEYLRPSIPSYDNALKKTKCKVFDFEQMHITQDDFNLARLVTPDLSSEFRVGVPWPIAWHQLRRTGAVNMQASGIVSDASLQYQMKHVVRAMTLYYGQNHSKVRLEENAGSFYIRTMYEVLGRHLQQLTSPRFVSPHGDKRKSEIVRLISLSDIKKSENLAKRGVVAYRPVLLGICTSRVPCPYGGVDNIAHCGGGESQCQSKPCPDVLYDSNKLHALDALEHLLNERLFHAEENSPLKESLEAQKRSLENYRHVVGDGRPE